MVNDHFEDSNRRFIIAVYPCDDTIAVFEIKSRNSGHSEGKFAERGKKHKPDSNDYYLPSDVYVGQDVVVSSVRFRILRADEYTLKFMEEIENAESTYPNSNISLIIKTNKDLTQYIQTSTTTTTITVNEFKNKFSSINEQQMITILRFAGNNDNDTQINIGKLKKYI